MLGMRGQDGRGGHRDLGVRERGQRALVERDQLFLERAPRPAGRLSPARARARRSAVTSRSASASGRCGVPSPTAASSVASAPAWSPSCRRSGREQRIDVRRPRRRRSAAPISRRHSPSSSPPSSVSARAVPHRRRSAGAGEQQACDAWRSCEFRLPGEGAAAAGARAASAARSRARRCRRSARPSSSRHLRSRSCADAPRRGRAARGARPRAAPRGSRSPARPRRGDRGARAPARPELDDARARALEQRLRAPVVRDREIVVADRR